MREEPFRRAAQKALAADVTTLVHGAEATAAVQAATEALFGKGDLARAGRAHAARRHGGAARWRRSRRGRRSSRPWWPCGLVDTRNAARRVLGEGGASVNNVKVSDPEAQLDDGDFLHGRGGAAAPRAQVPRRGPARCLTGRATCRPGGTLGARPSGRAAYAAGTGRRPLTSGFVISARGRPTVLFVSPTGRNGHH